MLSVDTGLSLLGKCNPQTPPLPPTPKGNFKGWIPPPFILTEHSRVGNQVVYRLIRTPRDAFTPLVFHTPDSHLCILQGDYV